MKDEARKRSKAIHPPATGSGPDPFGAIAWPTAGATGAGGLR